MNHTVFRVENVIGEGPYWTNNLYNLDLDVKASDDHPAPSWDGIPYDRALFFGFKNIDQMRDWFSSKELKTMRERGFTCNAYVVNTGDVHFGKKQIAFKKEEATFVYEVILDESIHGTR